MKNNTELKFEDDFVFNDDESIDNVDDIDLSEGTDYPEDFGSISPSQYARSTQTSKGAIRPVMKDLYRLDLRVPEIADDIKQAFDLESLGIHVVKGQEKPVIKRQALIQYIIEDGFNDGNFIGIDQLISMSDEPVESDEYLYGVYSWMRATAAQQETQGSFDAQGVNDTYKHFVSQAASKGHLRSIESTINNMSFIGTGNQFMTGARKKMIQEGIEKSSKMNGNWPIKMDKFKEILFQRFKDEDWGGIGHCLDLATIDQRKQKEEVIKRDRQTSVTPERNYKVKDFLFPRETIEKMIQKVERVIDVIDQKEEVKDEESIPHDTITLPGMGIVSVVLFTEDNRPAVSWSMYSFGACCESYLAWLDKGKARSKLSSFKSELKRKTRSLDRENIKELIQETGAFIDGVQVFKEEELN